MGKTAAEIQRLENLLKQGKKAQEGVTRNGVFDLQNLWMMNSLASTAGVQLPGFVIKTLTTWSTADSFSNILAGKGIKEVVEGWRDPANILALKDKIDESLSKLSKDGDIENSPIRKFLHKVLDTLGLGPERVAEIENERAEAQRKLDELKAKQEKKQKAKAEAKSDSPEAEKLRAQEQAVKEAELKIRQMEADLKAAELADKLKKVGAANGVKLEEAGVGEAPESKVSPKKKKAPAAEVSGDENQAPRAAKPPKTR